MYFIKYYSDPENSNINKDVLRYIQERIVHLGGRDKLLRPSVVVRADLLIKMKDFN